MDTSKSISDAWQILIKGNENRLGSIADGILIDKKTTNNNGQDIERVMRESVAAPYIGNPGSAIKEASRHHSYGVMTARARDIVVDLERNCSGSPLIMDLGCGFGWQWVDIAKQFPGVKFLLVDFAISNLLVCRSLMPYAEYSNVLCLQADISDMPLPDGVTDYCWSVQVLQHLPPVKRRDALKEIKRVQKAGAGLYIAWVRATPIIRAMYYLFGKRYHIKGELPDGVFYQRFDAEIETEVRNVFSSCEIRYSETLFHPELRLRPDSILMGKADLALSSSPTAYLLARQAEIYGRA